MVILRAFAVEPELVGVRPCEERMIARGMLTVILGTRTPPTWLILDRRLAWPCHLLWQDTEQDTFHASAAWHSLPTERTRLGSGPAIIAPLLLGTAIVWWTLRGWVKLRHWSDGKLM